MMTLAALGLASLVVYSGVSVTVEPIDVAGESTVAGSTGRGVGEGGFRSGDNQGSLLSSISCGVSVGYGVCRIWVVLMSWMLDTTVYMYASAFPYV